MSGAGGGHTGLPETSCLSVGWVTAEEGGLAELAHEQRSALPPRASRGTRRGGSGSASSTSTARGSPRRRSATASPGCGANAERRRLQETLVSSTGGSSRVGTGREVRDGRRVGHPEAESTRAYLVPGPWFLDAQSFVGRAIASPGSTLTTETVGPDFVVIVVRDDTRLEVRFDIESGIPVFFEDVTSGRLYERHEVTSLISQRRRIR